MRGHVVVAVLGCCVMLVLLGGCGGALVPTPADTAGTVGRLTALTASPSSLRWRDVAGLTDPIASAFSSVFQTSFNYASLPGSYASLAWSDSAGRFTGTLQCVALKPNLAYQIKLEGKAKITNAAKPASPQSDPMGWASWQLGHYGRWWCQTDGVNLSDAQLTSHVKRRHYVFGYLMFDFLVTDKTGGASKGFALDSSYHVLFRTDQRTPTGADSAVLPVAITRGAWGYGLAEEVTGPSTGVFAQGETGRPAPGSVALPAGTYPVRFAVAEESFHETGALCGNWATVLGTDVSFSVTGGGGRIAKGNAGL